MNSGISVTCIGSIIVLNTMTNRTLRPGNWMREKAKAAMEQEKSTATTLSVATKAVLEKNVMKSPLSQAST